MYSFRKYLSETPASDKFEKDIAAHIDTMKGINATRPVVSNKYSDVLITLDGGEQAWLETKLSHRTNLANPRIFYDGNKWDTTYVMKSAQLAVELMNTSPEAQEFIHAISKFSGIENPVIPTVGSGLKNANAVPLSVMRDYFNQPGMNRYILTIADVDLTDVVHDHYTNAKAEPVHYMQSGDDFYRIGELNPLNVPADVPLWTGSGYFLVRVATRETYYEVQVEIKVATMSDSPYSLRPGTTKRNPLTVE